ncbi:MAG: hypothetical protein PHS02_03830 [Candidatus ainarchaeum sp.]|nr:hypothetical protein [Candidatus ainarchaeum sp.]
MRFFWRLAFLVVLAHLSLAQPTFQAIGAQGMNYSTLQSMQGMFNGTEFGFAQKILGMMNQSDLENQSFEALASRMTLVVMGSGTDAEEKALWESAKAAYPAISNATMVMDGDQALAIIDSGKYPLVVLIGGPAQNRMTDAISRRGVLNESEEIYGQFIVDYGESNGSVVAALSDKKGIYNQARVSVKYSPLSAFIPPEYVPAAATGISLLLLALLSLGRTVFEFKALDIGRKGRKVGEGSMYAGPVNVSEIAAIVGASLVLGISISWQYFGPSPEFIFWLFINTAICLVAGIAHEIAHRILAWAFKIKMEYRFWAGGSLITLISSYLGNAFSVQGFILEEIPKETEKWKVGVMKLGAPLLSNAAMLLFAFINVFFPHPVFQVIYSTSALWAMAEMLPFAGLDGKDIKDWNFFVWLAAFVFVAACYIFVTFVL